MAVQRECCDHCMWSGPVNKDGTMRAHRPQRDDGTVGGRKVQDMTKPRCEGSHKPYARFGAEEPCGVKLLSLRGKFSTCVLPAGHERAHRSSL